MPYIPKEDREQYAEHINGLVLLLASRDKHSLPGHLNFVIYSILLGICQAIGTRYSLINDLVGALHCCSREFYRRVAGPYEDKAIDKNGDVL